MTAKRIVLVLAGACAAALALACAAALNPAVQTWAARRAIARANGPVVSIERVSVGPGRAYLRGDAGAGDEASLVVPAAEARLAVLPALLGRGFRFTGLSAKGWTLRPHGLPRPRRGRRRAADTPGWPAPSAAPSRPSTRARTCRSTGSTLEGDVVFPDEEGGPRGPCTSSSRGAGSAGARGPLPVPGDRGVNDASAAVSSVGVEADAHGDHGGLRRDHAGRPEGGREGQRAAVPGGIGLSCKAWVARDAGRASYSVSLIRGIETVAQFDAASPDGSLKMAGSWRLNLRDTDLAPFALGRSLPTFFADGGGAYEVDPSTGDVRATGKLWATADRLGVVAGGLGRPRPGRAPGRLRHRADRRVPAGRPAGDEPCGRGAGPVGSGPPLVRIQPVLGRAQGGGPVGRPRRHPGEGACPSPGCGGCCRRST